MAVHDIAADRAAVLSVLNDYGKPASIWRTEDTENTAGDVTEGTPTQIGDEVNCIVQTLQTPVEVTSAGKVRGVASIELHLPALVDVIETDEVRVQTDLGEHVFDVVGLKEEIPHLETVVYVRRIR